MTDTRGLYQKFHVERRDGKSGMGQKHEFCDYFVLDMTHDPHAWPAIQAYAKSCENERPALSRQLKLRYARNGVDGDTYARLRKASNELAGSHTEVDDAFYNCPKSESGCSNAGEGDVCVCGRDDRAEQILTALLAAWRGL